MEEINDYIVKNYTKIEHIFKHQLGDRYAEGISELYIHLHKTGIIPKDTKWIWYFAINMKLSNSKLNYKPRVGGYEISYLEDEEVKDYISDETTKNMIKIDLGSDELVDFLVNNGSSEYWIKIYDVIYGNKMKMNIFESSLYEMVFEMGWGIRKIAEITGLSVRFVYIIRKTLIKKIKNYINGDFNEYPDYDVFVKFNSRAKNNKRSISRVVQADGELRKMV